MLYGPDLDSESSLAVSLSAANRNDHVAGGALEEEEEEEALAVMVEELLTDEHSAQ